MLKHDLLEQYLWDASLKLYAIGSALLALLTAAWWIR